MSSKMKTVWLHYTRDPEAFAVLKPATSEDPASFAWWGLCVYRYYCSEQEIALEIGWQREHITIECDEQYVELLQENPLDDNPWYDEYIIPIAHFDKCTITH
ncbi:MAG: hypothetical protein FJW34_25370 [Acidobacteria bacterium]|nr:hypothetical protein [Acidobacteriota bacterium]